MKPRKKEKRENWLLIKEKDELARPDEDGEAFLAGEMTSITTGRSMEEIGAEEGGEGGDQWSSDATRGKGGRASASGRRKGAAETPKTAAGSSAKTRSTTKKKASGTAEAVSLDDLAKTYGKPQLATLVDDPPKAEGWLHEIKFDGYRLFALVGGGEARLLTRNGKDWTEKFGRLARMFEKLDVSDGVFDMEAVVLDNHGRSDFQMLQNALSEETDRGSVAFVFDCLHLNGGARRRDLEEGRRALSRRPDEELAQVEMHQASGIRHRRLHQGGRRGAGDRRSPSRLFGR